MGGHRSKAASWNPVLDSKRIRAIIQYEMQKRCWTLKRLSEESGLDYPRLSRYFNYRLRGITSIQLYHLLTMLGYSVDLKITKIEDEVSE